MKKYFILFLAFSFIIPSAFAGYVRGYYRKDGTYVEPHYRSDYPRNTYSKIYKNYPYNPYKKKNPITNPYFKRTYRTDGAMGF